MRIAILDDYQSVALKMADWDSLKPHAEAVAFHEYFGDQSELARRLQDFDCVVLMRERTPFRRNMIDGLPKLRLIIRLGHNAAIDFDAAAERGITICGTTTLMNPTAELTWGLILSLTRKIPAEDAAMRQGRWQTTLGIGLAGRTLGVLGLGQLGSSVARIGQAFGMNVIAWSPNLTAARAAEYGVEHVSKDALFERSDVLSIHVVLSDRSRGVVGAADLARMKPTAYLVNTSRGPIVHERALIDTLQSRRIAGAALDVFDVEPLPAGHPFLKLDNVVLTPHIGYVTEENYRCNYGDAVEDIRAYLEGKPIRVITGAKK